MLYNAPTIPFISPFTYDQEEMTIFFLHSQILPDFQSSDTFILLVTCQYRLFCEVTPIILENINLTQYENNAQFLFHFAENMLVANDSCG